MEENKMSLKKRVDTFALNTIKETETRNKMLGSTISQISNFSSTGANIEVGLESLNKKIKSLDPSLIDFSKAGKFFGIFSPTTRYFNKIKQEENAIEMLVNNLEKEKSILVNDNITLELEIQKLHEVVQNLNNDYDAGLILKDEILNKIQSESDETSIRFYNENILNPLEKKLFDLKQMSLVNEQSILALEIVRRNNKEIIRNIDRVKNVTIVALNTAVIVAKSLYNQKITLSKINSLGKSTSGIMNSTSKALSDSDLKDAFKNAYNTFDEVFLQNKKDFPENEIKIIELKKVEEGYDEK